jgi:hypothetical protein
MGDILGADDAVKTSSLHFEAAEAEETGLGQSGGEGADDLRAVMVAGGLAGR